MSDNTFKEIEQEVLNDLLQLAEKIKQLLIKETKAVIDEHDIRASGDLRKGVDGEVEQKAAQIIVEVFDNMFYSPFVHEGTKPHFPPIDAIAKWVVRKGLSSGTIKRKGSIGNMAESSEVRNRAFLIARAIAKKGTKGKKFFELALKQADPGIDKLLQAYS